MKMSLDIGPVHFVGIGGIGMSGIAEVMVNLGYTVQGSDVAENANVVRLREKGVTVAIVVFILAFIFKGDPCAVLFGDDVFTAFHEGEETTFCPAIRSGMGIVK